MSLMSVVSYVVICINGFSKTEWRTGTWASVFKSLSSLFSHPYWMGHRQMHPLTRITATCNIAIRPRHLNDPEASVMQQLVSLLFTYSETLGGMPLCLTIEGIVPVGRLLDDGSVYTSVLASFIVYKAVPNTYLPAVNGTVLGVFPCVVDGADMYTGRFRVERVAAPNKIIGTVRSNHIIL